MTAIQPEDVLQWLRSRKDAHPEPVTIRSLQSGLREELQHRPTMSGLRELLHQVPGAETWVSDLDPPPIRTGATELIEQWVATPAARDALRASLLEAFSDDRLDPEADRGALNVARAIGALDDAPDWEAIKVVHWSKSVRAAVLERAIEQEAFAFVLDTVCLGPDPLNRAERDAISRSGSAAAPAIAERISRWTKESRTDAVRSDAVNRIVQISSVIDDGLLCLPLVRAVASIGKTSGSEKWVGPSLKRATKDPATLRLALEQLSADEVGVLLAAITKLPMDVGAPRSQVLAQMAMTRHLEVLARPEVWNNAPLELLDDLASNAEIGGRLLSVAEGAFRTRVDRFARTTQLGSVLSIPTKWPTLAPFVEVRHVAEAAIRNDAGARLLQLLRDADAAKNRVELDRIRDELDAANLRIERETAEHEDSKSELAAVRAERDELRARAVAASESRPSRLAAELNQGRMDVLASIVDLVERVRALGSLSDVSTAVVTLLRDAAGIIERLGVQVRGEPGQLRAGDPALDEIYTDEGLVEVIAPAYLIDDVTLLRRAFVRPVGR